jgi:hypothetical protein
MENLKIEISLNDIVEDMFVDCEVEGDHGMYGASPRRSFSDEVKASIVSSVSASLISSTEKSAIENAGEKSKEVVNSFINGELQGILTRRLRSGELKTRFNGFKSYDELIEDKLSRIDIEKIIEKHIDIKTKEFAKEMRLRYDNVFAAKVVQGLNDQKMLDPNIAKLLLGDDA